MYENKIRWGDAFMILFDINDPKSFDEVTRIRLLISHYHTPPRLEFLKHKLKDKIRNANEDREKQVKSDQWFNPPVILVGTHTDKRSKDSIPTKTAKEKAQELGSKVAFFSFFKNILRMWIYGIIKQRLIP